MQEDIPSKRGGRATTRRPSGSGKIISAGNGEDPVLRDALGLPPRSPNVTANITTMGTVGADEDAHWRSEFEPEEHRRPRVTEPSTPLQAGDEEVHFGATRPPDEGLVLASIREAPRSCAGSAPPGLASRSALVAMEVVDLMEDRHRVSPKAKRLYARLA